MFDGSFCLTGDSLLKILAILYRIKCKIPVILLGECGCGKTVCYTFHNYDPFISCIHMLINICLRCMVLYVDVA